MTRRLQFDFEQRACECVEIPATYSGSKLVLWAELPGAEICHLPGRTAIASLAELGRTGRTCNFDEIHIISIKLSSESVVQSSTLHLKTLTETCL